MPTTLKPQYLYPPRPNTCIPRTELNEFGKMGWIAQLKYNGARCLIKYLPDGTIELWGRHAERFKKYTPPEWLLGELEDLKLALDLKPNEWSLLDGELLDFKHEAIRDTIAIFDILVQSGEYLVGTTYEHRYNQLFDTVTNENWNYHPPHKKHQPVPFGHCISEHLFIPHNWPWVGGIGWSPIWEVVDLVNAPYEATGKGPVIEGLVAKNPKGELSRAWNEQNNGEWMTRSRVTTGRHKF